jgi:predicted permease
MTMGEQMSTLWGDVRFAARQLVRQPVYALTVVVLMSVGVAGNAAVFRVVNGLFIRPLPFDHPEELVDLDETAPQWDLEFLSIAYRDFDRWRAENGTFQSMAATDLGGGNALIAGSPVRVTYLSTTHDIDEVLGIEPLLGRFYGPEEDHPDGPRGGLLSRGFWTQHFAADPGVLGSTITVNGYPIEVLGVLPPEADFLSEVDMWLPLRADPADFDGWGLSGIGRLRVGVTVEQAREDLTRVHKAMIPEFEVNEISSPVVHSLRDRYLGDYRLGSGFLLGSVAVVLLIACANIAALMFARSLSRGAEMSVRMAMGAPRRRIVRQLLTESAVLAGIGGLAGVALGAWGSGAIVAPLAEQFPRWVTFELDGRFLGFTAAITVLAAVVFGLAPALQASSAKAQLSTTRTTRSIGRRRVMGGLVAGEVALAMALLVVGSLSVLDVKRLAEAHPGFEAEGLIAYSLSLPSNRYGDDEARLAFVEQYLSELEAIPGVRSASVTSGLPLSGHWGWFFQVDGAPGRAEGEPDPVVLNRIVSPAYFETAGVEFAAGRGFDELDGRDDGSLAVVVNETFVRTHLGHLDDPVGARIAPGTDISAGSSWLTVVGVARDVKHYGVDEEMRPGVYQPIRQFPLQGFQVALSVSGESSVAVSGARAVTAGLDSELPLYGVQIMTEEMDEALWTRRALSWLIAAFSTVALILAVAGIYGVISYSVGQRTREIGIRMAMGAQREDVLSQVVRQGMALVLVGTSIGVGVALAGAGVVSRLLVGVNPMEPLVYVSVAAVLVGVAAVANYLPARRAARLNPMGVLRGE